MPQNRRHEEDPQGGPAEMWQSVARRKLAKENGFSGDEDEGLRMKERGEYSRDSWNSEDLAMAGEDDLVVTAAVIAVVVVVAMLVSLQKPEQLAYRSEVDGAAVSQ
ncbi:hypothetical protein H8959_001509 [Pygathrix nigripes]